MITEDQAEVIAFLSQPASYRIAGDVERIETHSAIVFLAGSSAFKLKRAVLYDYLDFSTRDRRRAACERELTINLRTAPRLYRRVRAITKDTRGQLAFDGDGAPLDFVVEMGRFDQAQLFDRLAARGALSIDLLEELADVIAAAHADAPVRFDHGGYAGMKWVIDGNDEAFHGFADTLDTQMVGELGARCCASLNNVGALLETRRREGRVRECHGDLHLRNIVLLDGVPTLFDAVEFNDEISCVDVVYDLAFLIMDLWRLHLRAHANRLFNQYMLVSRDIGALPALPLFLACRSAVRAKTSATAAGLQADCLRAVELRAAAKTYLDEAVAFVNPPSPRLVAIGGLAGSGKSSLARLLAPGIGAVPGALVVRSDVVRKALFDVAPTRRLRPEAYSPAVNRRVYGLMRDVTQTALGGGHAVVVDAVFAEPDERAAIARLARTLGVPFTGLWLDAPFDVAAGRIAQRESDASDATVDVLKLQSARDLGKIDWPRLDASVDAQTLARRATQLLDTAAATIVE
jgi:aminoglycoside phosphotransferase family enzyme/predicted kinase